jgi:hypothetical protein
VLVVVVLLDFLQDGALKAKGCFKSSCFPILRETTDSSQNFDKRQTKFLVSESIDKWVECRINVSRPEEERI